MAEKSSHAVAAVPCFPCLVSVLFLFSLVSRDFFLCVLLRGAVGCVRVLMLCVPLGATFLSAQKDFRCQTRSGPPSSPCFSV